VCTSCIQAIFLDISFPWIPESCNHHRNDFAILWEPLFNCPFLWVHFQLLGGLLVFFLPMSFAPFELCLHFNHCSKSQLSWAFFRNYGWLFHRLQCSAMDDQLLHCIRVSPKLVMHFFRVLLTLFEDWEVIGWSSSCWWICVLASSSGEFVRGLQWFLDIESLAECELPSLGPVAANSTNSSASWTGKHLHLTRNQC